MDYKKPENKTPEKVGGWASSTEFAGISRELKEMGYIPGVANNVEKPYISGTDMVMLRLYQDQGLLSAFSLNPSDSLKEYIENRFHLSGNIKHSEGWIKKEEADRVYRYFKELGFSSKFREGRTDLDGDETKNRITLKEYGDFTSITATYIPDGVATHKQFIRVSDYIKENTKEIPTELKK